MSLEDAEKNHDYRMVRELAPLKQQIVEILTAMDKYDRSQMSEAFAEMVDETFLLLDDWWWMMFMVEQHEES